MILRGWMLNAAQYDSSYRQLERHSIHLITTPEQYCTMHLFPNVYPLFGSDMPRVRTFPKGERSDFELITADFPRFIIKDFVKPEKGTDFPTFFTNDIGRKELDG